MVSLSITMEHLISQDTIHLSTTNIHNPNINNKIQISNHSTIINMIKDKGVLTYQQISEKYTDVEGKPISISDVQNVCSDNKAYSLDEDDFININPSAAFRFTVIGCFF
jgi:uncharacterized protein YcsI (UPF0317 family)